MTPDKFDQIVKNRANDRVQKRIKDFKSVLHAQIGILTGQGNYAFLQGPLDQTIMGIVMSEKPNDGWPAELWTREEKGVSDEILGTMDELAKALVARNGNPDDVTRAP